MTDQDEKRRDGGHICSRTGQKISGSEEEKEKKGKRRLGAQRTASHKDKKELLKETDKKEMTSAPV